MLCFRMPNSISSGLAAPSLKSEGHGHGEVNGDRPAVECGRLVFPLLHRADRGVVEERVEAAQDADGIDVSRPRDDGLQDADPLHAGLARRLGIRRLHGRDFDRLLDLAADPEGLLALLAEHAALDAAEDTAHDAARDAAFYAAFDAAFDARVKWYRGARRRGKRVGHDERR